MPNGRIAIGGASQIASCPTLSRHWRAQPTVPSPPHTNILYCFNFLNTYSLQYEHRIICSFHLFKQVLTTIHYRRLALAKSIVIPLVFGWQDRSLRSTWSIRLLFKANHSSAVYFIQCHLIVLQNLDGWWVSDVWQLFTIVTITDGELDSSLVPGVMVLPVYPIFQSNKHNQYHHLWNWPSEKVSIFNWFKKVTRQFCKWIWTDSLCILPESILAKHQFLKATENTIIYNSQ